MAGGEFAEHVICMECGQKASRTYEGQETDQYTCESGHQFSMDWSRGVPTEPQWPASEEMLELLKSMGVNPGSKS